MTSPICSLYKSNFGTLRKWSAILLTLTKSTILPSLAIWCATPDGCRSLSGLVLPVAAARVVLPAALQGLDRQQMTAPPPELLWERGGVALREREREIQNPDPKTVTRMFDSGSVRSTRKPSDSFRWLFCFISRCVFGPVRHKALIFSRLPGLYCFLMQQGMQQGNTEDRSQANEHLGRIRQRTL